MTKKNLRESDLYVPVEKWAKKHFGYLSGNTTNHNWFKWFGEMF